MISSIWADLWEEYLQCESLAVVASNRACDYIRLIAALQAERETLRVALADWVKQNSPGGWIDALRKERDELLAQVERLKKPVSDDGIWVTEARKAVDAPAAEKGLNHD